MDRSVWLQHMEHLFRQAMFEVMEKMYFLFLEPSSKEEAVEPNWYTVEVRFSGAWQGMIEIQFSLPIVMAMVENVLGVLEGEKEEQLMEDTMKECVNMIAGNFLQKLEPEKAIHLTIPNYLGKQAFEGGKGDVVIALASDGRP